MSRQVQITSSDQQTILGTVELQSDFPATPGVLIVSDGPAAGIYVAGSGSYGGALEQYISSDSISLSASDIKAP